MKKILTISILFILLAIVFYNNSSMHVSEYKFWKYNDYEEGYEQKLIFSKDINGNYLYRYEWPYIYKYDQKIGHVVFCIGDRMWVKYYVKDAKIVEYVGK